MERLSASELDKVKNFLETTAAPCDLTNFPSLILPAVHDLVPGDIVCLSESNEVLQKSVTFEVYPEGAHMDADLFDLFMFDHPVFQHWAQVTGSPTACTSQVTSMRQWHHTDLYQSVYRPLGLEDSLGMALPARPGLVACICIERARRFSDRDRVVMDMVRPYLTQLYRNAELFSLLGQSSGSDKALSVVVDEAGRPLLMPAAVIDLLAQYFPDTEISSGFPVPVISWLRGQVMRLIDDDTLPSVVPPLIVSSEDGSKLTLRLRPGTKTGEQSLLLLREQRAQASTIPGELGLSHREIEVLTLAKRGLRNSDIADSLRISRRTVEKHFENLYSKLGVDNRAGAVGQAFVASE